MHRNDYRCKQLRIFLTAICSLGMWLQMYAQKGQQERAVSELVARILPRYKDSFVFETIPKGAKDSFNISTATNGKVCIKGNNGVAMASGFYHYLVDYCHANITWDSRQLEIPAILPKLKSPIGKSTLYDARYYLNYCTYNYSMSWWDWDRWQNEIDWMAMHGINMPLALTGEESVWSEVYKEMGLKNTDLNSFFSGPAYFSWFWMGNLDAWNGSLSTHWMERQKKMQLQILSRERSLGMTPILPAFTGHVPKALKHYYPSAKIKNTNWDAGFEDVDILAAEDPLFDKIGQLFLKKQTAIFGTNHLYSADTFNENVPPSNDSTYLDGITKKIFASMQTVDSEAKWLMQGWMFHYNKAYWGEKQVSSLLHAIPKDRLVILDLYSESHPMWETAHAYYGRPWIWNMLQNFGGNIGMFGRMDAVAKEPYLTFKKPEAGNMIGIGLAPEGIEQNPALFELMLQNVWSSDTIEVTSFLKKYTRNRYGDTSLVLNKAWEILHKTVYNGGFGEGTPESIIVAHPMLSDSSQRVRTSLNYAPKDLVVAWKLFLEAPPKIYKNEAYLYDLTDVTRQVLANYAYSVYTNWRNDLALKDWKNFEIHSGEFLQLMKDMDMLLASNRHFLLGKWIADARACGITIEEKDLYEKNARDLITLWGGRASGLSEYSNRQWAGLIEGYYMPRWKMYFKYILECHNKGLQIKWADIDTQILDWEWHWVNSNKEKFATKAKGNTLEIAQKLFHTYYAKMLQ